jgi:hypothetical protein
MAEVSSEIAITGLPQMFRVDRRESPILALGEKRVGWGTHGNVLDEQVLPTPNIIPVGMDSQR